MKWEYRPNITAIIVITLTHNYGNFVRWRALHLNSIVPLEFYHGCSTGRRLIRRFWVYASQITCFFCLYPREWSTLYSICTSVFFHLNQVLTAFNWDLILHHVVGHISHNARYGAKLLCIPLGQCNLREPQTTLQWDHFMSFIALAHHLRSWILTWIVESIVFNEERYLLHPSPVCHWVTLTNDKHQRDNSSTNLQISDWVKKIRPERQLRQQTFCPFT